MQHLTPRQAWAFVQADRTSLLIDVRMEVESMYVGRPPGAINIPWYEYPTLTPDPERFCNSVLAEAGGKERPLLLLCRSGQRTLAAGAALEERGWSKVINVLHGFEGDLDPSFHRSRLNGWRFDGLPWEQM